MILIGVPNGNPNKLIGPSIIHPLVHAGNSLVG